MRDLSEVQYLLDCVNSIYKRGPLVMYSQETPPGTYGFLVEIAALLTFLVNQYELAKKKSPLAVEEFGVDVEQMEVDANRAGVFLSRANDMDGAHFCFVLKNVYQFVMEKAESPWDRFPTRREDRVTGQ